MKRKLTCFCENTFEEEVPEEINLEDSNYLDQIQDGSFLNFSCPSCGKKHKPEFQISILWPSKKIQFEVFPDLDKGEFYRRKKQPEAKASYTLETIIGYPELADRLAVIRDGFEPAAVEAIKYFLYMKAEDQYPDQELEIWYFSPTGTAGAPPAEKSTMEFHIHGIRENEVAVMKVPISVYQKTLQDYTENPKDELFSSLKVNSYLSVKNTMRPEEFR